MALYKPNFKSLVALRFVYDMYIFHENGSVTYILANNLIYTLDFSCHHHLMEALTCCLELHVGTCTYITHPSHLCITLQ